MIALGDRIELPRGVEVRDGELHDTVRAVSVPLNASACAALATRPRTIRDVARALARAGARDAEADAVAFCRELNARSLLNIRVPLRRGVAALRYGVVERRPVRRTHAIVRGLVPFIAVVSIACAPLVAVARPAALAALGCGIGVALHELAHAVALAGLPRALVVDRWRPSILHPPVGAARMLVVAAAGPLAPALAALAVLASFPAAAAACAPLAAHALGLTVLAPDGRNACGVS